MVNPNQPIWLGGWHTILGIVRHQPHRLRRVLLAEGKAAAKQKQLLPQLESLGVLVEFVRSEDLDHVAGGVHHQGVAALCKTVKERTEGELFEALASSSAPPLLLLLDEVQDPRNLGACLRVADAAGCFAVVLEKRNSAPLSAQAEKSASGACLPIYRVPGLVRVIGKLKALNIWVYGADPTGKATVFESDLTGGIAWVMGSEGKGLRALVKKSCDHLVQIPMSGTVDSLNVSAATAVCLFETLRQRPKLS